MSTMFESEPDAGGIIDSIRRFGNSLTGLLHTRAELFAVELQEEKLRAIRLLVWVAVAITLGVAGLLVAVGGLALFFWELPAIGVSPASRPVPSGWRRSSCGTFTGELPVAPLPSPGRLPSLERTPNV